MQADDRQAAEPAGAVEQAHVPAGQLVLVVVVVLAGICPALRSRMSAQGIIVVHFTPRRIRTHAAKVAAELRAAIEAGPQRPPLDIRADDTGRPLTDASRAADSGHRLTYGPP